MRRSVSLKGMGDGIEVDKIYYYLMKLICCVVTIIIFVAMLILFETAAGYALFRTDKPKKLEKV